MPEPEDTVDVYPGADRPVAVPAEIVLAAQREYRAYVASQKGTSWDEIAVTENYPDAKAAKAAVRRYLREGEVLAQDYTKAELLALEIARLNALQSYFWEGATQGKVPAGQMVLACIGARIKLLKLDEIETEEGARTVVVLGNEQDYSRILDEVAAS